MLFVVFLKKTTTKVEKKSVKKKEERTMANDGQREKAKRKPNENFFCLGTGKQKDEREEEQRRKRIQQHKTFGEEDTESKRGEEDGRRVDQSDGDWSLKIRTKVSW